MSETDTANAAEQAQLTSQQRGAILRAANNGGRHPGGLPSSYESDYCRRIIEYGKLGYSQAMMASELGVSKQTITRWAAEKEEFRNALEIARTHAQRWWEREAQDALRDKEFNAGLWDRSVKSRFREDYTDRTINELVGKDNGPIEVADSMANARRIAFMLGRAVGKLSVTTQKADDAQP